MRRAIAVIAGLFLLTVVSSGNAFAADPVENAINSLKTSPVYVEAGTENTDRDTVAGLKSSLSQNDHIFLVMLPASAADNTSIDDIAQRIDDATGHKHIIGLAVGSKTIGFSSLLPAGVATDSMSRADSLANRPVDALATYVKIIHEWQKANPEPQPESPATAGGETTSNGPRALTVIAVGVIMGLIGLWFTRRFVLARSDDSRPSLKASPSIVRDELSQLHELSGQVHSVEMRDTISQIITDTEAFFKRSVKSSTHDTAEDAQIFERHLQAVVKVVERYVDIQENPRFYDDPRDLMVQGSAAIAGFAEYVLMSIKRDSATALTNYRVDSNILSAQRYS